MALHKEVFDEFTISNEVGIIVPNHLASSLDDTLADRAYYLNRALGLPVVAFERPGTGSLDRIKPLDVETYVEDVNNRGQELQGILDALGIKRAVITHDSAGGLDSLALGASGQIEVERVVAIEPIGMFVRPSNFRAIAVWGKANLTGTKGKRLAEFRGLEDLPPIRGDSEDLTGRMIKEGGGYKYVYCSDVGRTFLRQLRDENVPVNLILSEHNSATPPKEQAELQMEFEEGSVDVEIVHGAHHKFTEPYSHFVHVVRKAIKPVLDGLKEPEV